MYLVETLVKEQVANTELGVILRNDRPVVSSRDVARVFEKEHKDVLKSIRAIGCSPEFGQRNFAPSSYINEQGREMPEYLMSRDGFTLLAMGYTGDKAMKFKEAYINEFNRLEAQAGAGIPEIELLARIATNMAEAQRKQQAINQLQDLRLQHIDSRVTQIFRTQEQALESLTELPEAEFSPPPKSTRIIVYQRVLSYARANHLPERTCFNILYSEFKARYHIDLKKRSANRKFPSALQYAEADGFIEEVHALACRLFPAAEVLSENPRH